MSSRSWSVNAAPRAGAGSWRVVIDAPVAVSQRCTVWSSPVATTVLPSALNVIECTSMVSLSSTAVRAGCAASATDQSSSRCSSLPTASVPAGPNATERTAAPRWASTIPDREPRSQSRAEKSSPPLASRFAWKARLSTAPACPFNSPAAAGCAGSATCHSAIVPSARPSARRVLSPLNAADLTAGPSGSVAIMAGGEPSRHNVVWPDSPLAARSFPPRPNVVT